MNRHEIKLFNYFLIVFICASIMCNCIQCELRREQLTFQDVIMLKEIIKEMDYNARRAEIAFIDVKNKCIETSKIIDHDKSVIFEINKQEYDKATKMIRYNNTKGFNKVLDKIYDNDRYKIK